MCKVVLRLIIIMLLSVAVLEVVITPMSGGDAIAREVVIMTILLLLVHVHSL